MVWWQPYVDPEPSDLQTLTWLWIHSLLFFQYGNHFCTEKTKLLHEIPSRIALNHTFNDDVKLNHDGRLIRLTNFECVLIWHFSKVKDETFSRSPYYFLLRTSRKKFPGIWVHCISWIINKDQSVRFTCISANDDKITCQSSEWWCDDNLMSTLNLLICKH